MSLNERNTMALELLLFLLLKVSYEKLSGYFRPRILEAHIDISHKNLFHLLYLVTGSTLVFFP